MQLLFSLFLLLSFFPLFGEIEQVTFVFPSMEKAREEELIAHLTSYHGVKKIINIKNQKNLSISCGWNNNARLVTKSIANYFVGYPRPLLYISGHAKFEILGTTGVYYLYSLPDKSAFFLEPVVGKKMRNLQKRTLYFRGTLDLQEDILHLIALVQVY
jgi:hypothetical protein